MQMIRTVVEKLNRCVLGANTLQHPNRFTARGVSRRRWQRTQIEHELNYWLHQYPREVPDGFDRRDFYRSYYWKVNRGMFKTLDGVFDRARVVDVGCGPYGSMDYSGAAGVIGIDPLAHEYQHHYGFDDGLLILNAPAESIPLLDESADVVVSVNALDHMCRPYEALEEMHRICRRGGHFALATDVGGTPQHPCNIDARHLDDFFGRTGMKALEQDCGTHIPSGWPPEMQVPVYVFHGVKG
jgi:SAM-dependent methyltransferase